MSPAPQLIRSACLIGYAELARASGFDPLAMMRKVGLPRRCLDDCEMPISMAAVSNLLEQSAEASGMADFGLRLASRRRLFQLGPVSLVMRQERNALGALHTLFNYNRLLNGALLARIEEEGAVVVIREDLIVPRAAAIRQSIELTIGVLSQALRELLGPGWHPRVVCFTHRPPPDPRFHHSVLGRAVEFNAGFNGIVCTARDLQQELPAAVEDGLAGLARRFLDEALSERGSGTSETVRHLIAASLGNGRCTVEKVAHHLGVSRQTLHRQLGAEHESFSSLLDSVRREVVLRLQKDSDQPLEDVAGMLGFSCASAFAHWFRAAFGTSFARSRRGHHAAA